MTIPAEIRQLSQVKPHDCGSFVVEGELVHLVRGESVVERTAGALKQDKPPLTAEELRRVAEEAIAEEAASRMG